VTLPAPIIIDPHSVTSLRFGVLGPGVIADTWVGSVHQYTAQRVHAVASRTPEKAEAFAAKFGIAHVEGSYEALVAREDIDAIYISSYPIDHFEHAMLAIAAHKHVLIEKPITLQADQAKELLQAAQAEGVFAMEAMWTRYLPHGLHTSAATG
jgi:predicted dehydrogenase